MERWLAWRGGWRARAAGGRYRYRLGARRKAAGWCGERRGRRARHSAHVPFGIWANSACCPGPNERRREAGARGEGMAIARTATPCSTIAAGVCGGCAGRVCESVRGGGGGGGGGGRCYADAGGGVVAVAGGGGGHGRARGDGVLQRRTQCSTRFCAADAEWQGRGGKAKQGKAACLSSRCSGGDGCCCVSVSLALSLRLLALALLLRGGPLRCAAVLWVSVPAREAG